MDREFAPPYFSRDVICVAPDVTIPDPTEGYGIFIENMLSTAEVIPKAKAS